MEVPKPDQVIPSFDQAISLEPPPTAIYLEFPYPTAAGAIILAAVNVHCVPFVEYAILLLLEVNPTATHLSPYTASKVDKNKVVPRPVHCVPS